MSPFRWLSEDEVEELDRIREEREEDERWSEEARVRHEAYQAIDATLSGDDRTTLRAWAESWKKQHGIIEYSTCASFAGPGFKECIL